MSRKVQYVPREEWQAYVARHQRDWDREERRASVVVWGLLAAVLLAGLWGWAC